MSQRPQTINAGASLERQAILAWAERRGDKALIAYLKGRAKRNAAVPGGLGRKKR